MTWSGQFVDALSAPTLRPVYLLEGWGGISHGGSPPPRRWAVASVRMRGSLNAPIIPEQCSYMGQAITIRSWAAQHGSVGIAVGGSPSYLAASGIHRGQLVTLSIGFPGVAPQRVWMGVLQNVHDRGGWALIECRDIAVYFASRRYNTIDPPLFSGLGSTTTVAAPARAAGGVTLTVASTTGFGVQSSGVGVVRVTTGGTAYYLRYTGTTATQFTGVTLLGHGTVDASASIGDLVEEIAYIDAHPIDVARQVICSTGTASANGPHDVLPQSWGFAFPTGWLDHADCDRQIAVSSPSTGIAEYQILADTEQADGWAWLSALLSPGGWVVTQRQGSLSVRAILSPWEADSPGTRSVEIRDEHLVEIGDGEWWDGEAAAEYVAMRVTGGTSTATTTGLLASHPAEAMHNIDLTDPLTGVWYNESAWRTALRDRLARWYTRVPERRELTLMGWRWATLAPGDIVRLSSRLMTGRGEIAAHGYRGRRALVVAVEPQWFTSPTTRVTLSLISED